MSETPTNEVQVPVNIEPVVKAVEQRLGPTIGRITELESRANATDNSIRYHDSRIAALESSAPPPPDPDPTPDPTPDPGPVDPPSGDVIHGFNLEPVNDDAYWNRMPWKNNVLWQAPFRNGRFVAFVGSNGRYPRGSGINAGYQVLPLSSAYVDASGNDLEIHPNGDPAEVQAVMFPSPTLDDANGWHPHTVALLRRFGGLRFLDWQLTNTHGEGAKTSDMVSLSNATACIPWLCVYDRWDDNRVAGFAENIDNQLASGLRARIEFSNEVWNSAHTAKFERIRGVGGNWNTLRDNWAAGVDRIFNIFRSVMGNRAICVFAGQEVDPNAAEDVLGRMKTKPDEISSSFYFGNSAHKSITSATESTIFDYCEWDIDRKAEKRRQWGSLAKSLGVPYSGYEGGAHVMPYKDISLGLLTAVSRSTRMGELVGRNIDEAVNAGMTTLMHYSFCRQIDGNGAWGHREYYDETTPRWDAVVEAAKQ